MSQVDCVTLLRDLHGAVEFLFAREYDGLDSDQLGLDDDDLGQSGLVIPLHSNNV